MLNSFGQLVQRRTTKLVMLNTVNRGLKYENRMVFSLKHPEEPKKIKNKEQTGVILIYVKI